MSTDIEWQTNNASSAQNQQLLNALADLPNQTSGSNTTSTYGLYEDQITLAGEAYEDAEFAAFTQNGKRVISMAIIPIEISLLVVTTTIFTRTLFQPTYGLMAMLAWSIAQAWGIQALSAIPNMKETIVSLRVL